jgi:hypothetical protein
LAHVFAIRYISHLIVILSEAAADAPRFSNAGPTAAESKDLGNHHQL